MESKGENDIIGCIIFTLISLLYIYAFFAILFDKI